MVLDRIKQTSRGEVTIGR